MARSADRTWAAAALMCSTALGFSSSSRGMIFSRRKFRAAALRVRVGAVLHMGDAMGGGVIRQLAPPDMQQGPDDAVLVHGHAGQARRAGAPIRLKITVSAWSSAWWAV